MCSRDEEGDDAKDAADRADDPEAEGDLRLRPAEPLEVMMDRREEEDALARQFDASHLQDYGASLNDEDDADER